MATESPYDAWYEELARRFSAPVELPFGWMMNAGLVLDETYFIRRPSVWYQRQLRRAMLDYCVEMRREDLPPLLGNQMEVQAKCAVCGQVHRFRLWVTELTPTPKAGKPATEDWFTQAERLALIESVNAIYDRARLERGYDDPVKVVVHAFGCPCPIEALMGRAGVCFNREDCECLPDCRRAPRYPW